MADHGGGGFPTHAAMGAEDEAMRACSGRSWPAPVVADDPKMLSAPASTEIVEND
ncbi:hypothetical protein ACRAWD_28905 [Caulobacter segnis]